jgi:DNA-directed RNA polymerase I, II, and III subunit RPABC2
MSKNPSYFSEEEEEEENVNSDEEESVAGSEPDVVSDAEEEEDIEEGGVEKEEKEEKDDESVSNDVVLDEEDEDSEEEGDDDEYLQKFDEEINKNYILDVHPECAIHNKTEVMALSRVVRDKQGNIIDDLHRTIPFLTRFERARVIGQRAGQINSGATPFVKGIPASIIDGHIIAEMELSLKSIPFIIRRPLPNGGSEYWRVKDLANLFA